MFIVAAMAQYYTRQPLYQQSSQTYRTPTYQTPTYQTPTYQDPEPLSYR